jgi:hypothetical protein
MSFHSSSSLLKATTNEMEEEEEKEQEEKEEEEATNIPNRYRTSLRQINSGNGFRRNERRHVDT